MVTRSTFSPARKVFSTTAPVRTLRSLVRTNAGPLPGFTCWNSTTWTSLPSWSRTMPFFRSLVVVAIGGSSSGGCPADVCPARSGGHRVGILGGEGEGRAPLVGDDHRVLDAHAAVV